MRFIHHLSSFVLRLVLVGLLGMAGGGTATAKTMLERIQGLETPDDHPISVELIAEHVSLQPGERTRIGVLFTLEEDWHIYAQESGDAGLPTTVTWSAPPRLYIGALDWPPHNTFLEPGEIQTFGYADRALLTSDVILADGAEPTGTLLINANVTWLACREVCIPGAATLTLQLPVRDASAQPSDRAHEFELAPAQQGS